MVTRLRKGYQSVLCLAGSMGIAFSVVAISAAQQQPPDRSVRGTDRTSSRGADRTPAAQRGKGDQPTGQDRNIPAHERPFREGAQAFVDAYAQRDAEALGKLFTANAEFYSDIGERTEGRDAIVALFRQVFEQNPDMLIERIDIERVRPISERVTLEEGYVTTTEYPGAAPSTSRYVALHTLEADDQWRINSLKDYPPEAATAAEELAQLDWMVGEWVSEDAASVVHTSCSWSDDGNYLLRRFTVHVVGLPLMNGVQRIGWDPVRKEIRSWVFDSAGGYIEGTWRRNGDQWIVTSNGYNSEGETAVGVAIFTRLTPERITWQYRSLVVGNEIREAISPIVMVRRPPAPTIAD